MADTEYQRRLDAIRDVHAGGIEELDNEESWTPTEEAVVDAQPEWWKELSAESREVHYNRVRKCKHAYEYPGIAGNKSDDRLRNAYSFDPYMNTVHMMPCLKPAKCECQICLKKFGIWQGGKE